MSQKKGFVDLNVREVFEVNTIEGVQDIQKKVHYEIERKREELRMLVGESYRDLIDAADTIAVMKESSSDVVDRLRTFRNNVKGIPNHLGPVGGSFSTSMQQKSYSPSELEIAAELKVALESPRQIKFYLAQGKPVEALHLYLLTKQLQTKTKSYRMTSLHRLEWFFRNQSDIADPTKTMKVAILQYTEALFKNLGTAPDKLAESMVIYQLLSGESSEVTVKKFLQDQLQNCEAAFGKEAEDLSAAISFALQSVYTVFIEPQLYSNASKAVKKPVVSMKNIGVQFVPRFLEQFQNEVIQVDDAPRVSRLAEIIITGFLAPLKQRLSESYASGTYLAVYSSLEELEQYRQSLVSVFKSECEDLSRIVLGTTKSLWTEYFLEVYHRKCKVVIADAVKVVISYLRDDGFPEYQRREDEFDLVNFVWTPQVFTEDKAYSAVNDELQWKGVSPHVAELSRELDGRCLKLQQDAGSTSDQALKEFFSVHFGDQLEQLLSHLTNDGTTGSIFLGRWCVTLGELCPNLWKILKQNEVLKLRHRLTEIGEICFSQWSSHVLETFSAKLRGIFDDLTIQSLTKTMPTAEEFISEEEGTLKPSVRIPLQLSHDLQANMFITCGEFCRLGPQSIPKSIRDSFRFSIGEAIAKFYGTLDTSVLTPQVALQFIFDLKYIQWFHPNLSSCIDPVVKNFETVVDPFDLDIVYPKLKGNIKRCLFENHLTLGLLFSEESHGFVAQNFKTKGNKPFPSIQSGLSAPLPLLPV